MAVAVVVVAAGRGRRLGGETPKQYIPLGPKCALTRTLDVFLSRPAVQWILPVIHPDDRPLYDKAVRGQNDPRVLAPVAGADTRARSVRCGLEHLEQIATADVVLIHDAARPFLPPEVIDNVLTALQASDGACAALPVVDALWRTADSTAQEPVPREGLWRAQTPQGFRFDKIMHAHRVHDGFGADDVAVARAAGMRVDLVLGSEMNYKITTQTDLARALTDAAVMDASHAPQNRAALR